MPSGRKVHHTDCCFDAQLTRTFHILFCGVYDSKLHGKLFIVIQSLGLGVWVWFGDLG